MHLYCYCYCYSCCCACARLPFMHGIQFGCYLYIETNQDVDGSILLDPLLSLMAQYCRLPPGKDCLRWLQPGFLVAVPVIKFTPYAVSAGPCLQSFFSLCCVGIEGLAFEDSGLWRFGVVFLWGGDIRVPQGCLGIYWLVYCLWGLYFHTCQSLTLQNCFVR